MLCPTDGSTLLLSERQGIEIDYCPKCRGVWLDRGELDKILERESTLSYGKPPEGRGFEHRGFERHDDDDDRYEQGPHGRRRKRGGLLGELFDFD